MSTQPVHVQRRRWILWGPLVVLGVGILYWQVTTWSPSLLWILVGICLCLPWVGDVPDE